MLVDLGMDQGQTVRTYPTEVWIGAGFMTVVLACLAATAVFPPGHTTGRLVVVAVAVAGFAALVQDLVAALVTAGLAWPFYVGFLVDRQGDLHWHGGVDAFRLACLVAAACAGSALGRLTTGRPARRPRRDRPAHPRDVDQGIESDV